MKKFDKISLILFGLLLTSQILTAQTDSTNQKINISAYLETYYTLSPNQASHTRPGFIYSHNRSNEFNLNLGFIKASFQDENVRANLSLATGTYMNANYAAEQGVLKNIYEANVGFKIHKNKNLWLDAGIMPSHIGFESAVSKDCWSLTRSIMSDNSPYFETGAKITYTSPNEKWIWSGLLLNGWQRIQLVDGNNKPSFGHQLIYKPNEKWLINSSSFIGNDKPESVKQMRYFHNFYAIYQANKIGITFGLDYGLEQKLGTKNKYNQWYSPVLIAKFNPNAKSNLTARLEHYNDKNGVIVSSNTANGFQTSSFSINYDRKISEWLVWRMEVRNFMSKDPLFQSDKSLNKNNVSFTSSISMNFNTVLSN